MYGRPIIHADEMNVLENCFVAVWYHGDEKFLPKQQWSAKELEHVLPRGGRTAAQLAMQQFTGATKAPLPKKAAIRTGQQHQAWASRSPEIPSGTELQQPLKQFAWARTPKGKQRSCMRSAICDVCNLIYFANLDEKFFAATVIACAEWIRHERI
jgi:hypothetical protein